MKASIAKMLHQKARRNFARSARRLVRAMKMANDSLTELARSRFMAGSVGFVSKKSIARVNWRPRICVVASAIAISCVPGTATGALAKGDHNVNSIASIAADGGSVKMTKQEIKAEHIAQRAAADAAKAAAQLQNFNTNTMMQSAVNSAQSAMQAAALNVSTQAAAAAAQAGVQNSMQNLGSQAMAAQNTAVNLNLKSGKNDFFADINAPVNIMVGGSINSAGAITGGKIMTVNPGDKLSAAEHTAMLQSMAGNQTLLLGNNGAAQGGSLTLSGTTSSNFGNLAIPKNVSLNLVGFDSANALDVAGKTNIMGSVYALQNTGNVGSVFNLGSLNVHGSGVWTGSLPSSTAVSGLFSSSSLTFNVTNDVTNAGQILSPGALNINAGGPISNIGPTAVLSGSAVSLGSQQAIFNSGMIAATAGNVSLNSSVGQITNSGIVQSTLGNINIASQIPTNLTINNIGGLMSAVDGLVVHTKNRYHTDRRRLGFKDGQCYFRRRTHCRSG